MRYELQLTSGPSSTRDVCSAQAASSDQHSKCAPSRSPYSGKEVVPRVEEVGADLLDPVDGTAHRVVRAVLRVELDGDADRSHVRGITSDSSAMRLLERLLPWQIAIRAGVALEVDQARVPELAEVVMDGRSREPCLGDELGHAVGAARDQREDLDALRIGQRPAQSPQRAPPRPAARAPGRR